MVDRCLLVAEIVMYFADAIEDAAEHLVIMCSSREGQGLGGAGERLLAISELDVDKRDRAQRERLVASSLRGGPIESCSLKMADSLQHRFTRALPVRRRRQRNPARARDARSVAVRLGAHHGKHDLVAAGWSMRLGCSNKQTVLARGSSN